MTIAQVQPLNIVAASKARDFLCEADMLVTDVRSLFLKSDDFATATRLKDIRTFRVVLPMRFGLLSG